MKRSNLRENYIEKHPDEDLTGKQAHHIIPVEFLCELYNCEESKLSEEFNDEWNCLMLPARGEETALRHLGCHPKYTRMVGELVLEDIRNNAGQVTQMESIKTIALAIKLWYMDNNNILVDRKRSEKVNNIIKLLKETGNISPG